MDAADEPAPARTTPYLDPYADLRPARPVHVEGRPSVLVDGRVHLLATPSQRALAALLDFVAYRAVLFVLAVFGGVLLALHAAADDGVTGTPLTVKVLFAVYALYLLGPLTYKLGGQSPGKRLVGLRVVQADGAPLGLESALARETLFRAVPLLVATVVPVELPAFFDAALFALGFFVLLLSARDPQGRAWWDHVAGTVVVQHDALPLRPKA